MDLRDNVLHQSSYIAACSTTGAATGLQQRAPAQNPKVQGCIETVMTLIYCKRNGRLYGHFWSHMLLVTSLGLFNRLHQEVCQSARYLEMRSELHLHSSLPDRLEILLRRPYRYTLVRVPSSTAHVLPAANVIHILTGSMYKDASFTSHLSYSQTKPAVEGVPPIAT